MTSFRTPLRLIGAVLVLLLGAQSAQAQTYEGETPVDMVRGVADENGDIVRFRSLTIKWRFTGLMGEPLRQFAGRYEHHSPPWVELAGAPVCFAQHVVASFSPHKIEPGMVSEGALDGVDLYTHSRFRMIIETNSNLGFALGPSNVIQHYFGVDSFSQGADYGPSVPGSPEWDRLFQVGPVGSEDISWLSEAQARELFRVGFSVSRIDMVEPKYALAQVKASYERHFRSKPCGDRPVELLAAEEGEDEADGTGPDQVASVEDAQPDQPEPRTAADRLDAMLKRVAEAREKEKAAAAAHEAYIASLPVDSFEVADGWVTAGGEKISGPYSEGAFLAFGNEYVVEHECSPAVVERTTGSPGFPSREIVSRNCDITMKNSIDGISVQNLYSSNSEWIQFSHSNDDQLIVIYATGTRQRQCQPGLNLRRCGNSSTGLDCYTKVYNKNFEIVGSPSRYVEALGECFF
ncbi:MAG: hypothetical protein RLP98_14420 [Devosia sp.]